MHVKITEASGNGRHFHFTLIDENTARFEDKQMLIEIPFGISKDKVLNLAETAPKKFCVNYKKKLSTNETVVVEITHSTVPIETAVIMMKKQFDAYFKEMEDAC